MIFPAQIDLESNDQPARGIADADGALARRIDDPSSLAWVLEELRHTLAAAQKLLRRYLRESASHAGSDVSASELGSLRQARALIHQGIGATTVIGAESAARVLAASDTALRWALERPQRVDAALVEHVEQASFAVIDFLGRQLAGNPVSALWMFPQMRLLLETAGADRIHPADLWSWPWQWRVIAADPQASARPVDERSLSALEQLTLANIKTPSPLILARISDWCAGLALGFSAPAEEHTRILWQLASAVFEALANERLDADLFSKRLASRLLALLRSIKRGAAPDPAMLQRLAHDLLFFCSQSRPIDTVRASPRLAAVREAYALDEDQRVDYLHSPLGSFDPALVVQARKRVTSAKAVWSSLAAGELEHQAALVETFSLVADSLRRLFPDGARLADQLEAVAGAARGESPVPALELSMEVATALLYVEAALEETAFAAPDPVQPIVRLAERIDSLRDGGRAQALEPWIEDLYGRVADRQTLGTVVQELRSSMAAVEQQLDRYFRDHADLPALRAVPALLQSMRGVLAVLGVEQAALALQHMRGEIEMLLGGDPLQPAAQTLQRLANNVGALGFLFDMLGVQPALAKAMFRFDSKLGSLSTTLAPERLPAPDPIDAPHAAPPLLEDAGSIVSGGPDDLSTAGAAPSFEPPAARPDATAPAAGLATEAAPADTEPPAVSIAQARTGSRTSPAIDPELADIFSGEATELLQAARADLAAWRAGGGNIEVKTALVNLRRAFHTLKGSARMVGLDDIGELAWDAEQRFGARLADEAEGADSNELNDSRLRDWALQTVNRIERLIGPSNRSSEVAIDLARTAVGPFEATAPIIDLLLDEPVTVEVDLDITVPGELDFDLSWNRLARPDLATMSADVDVSQHSVDGEFGLEIDDDQSSTADFGAGPPALGLPPDLPSAADLDLDFNPHAGDLPDRSTFWNDSLKPGEGTAPAPRVASEITVEDIGRSWHQPVAAPADDLSFISLDLSDDASTRESEADNESPVDSTAESAIAADGFAPTADPDLAGAAEGESVIEIDPVAVAGLLDLYEEDGGDAAAVAEPNLQPAAGSADFIDLALDAPPPFADLPPEPEPDPVQPVYSPSAVVDWPAPDLPLVMDETGPTMPLSAAPVDGLFAEELTNSEVVGHASSPPFAQPFNEPVQPASFDAGVPVGNGWQTPAFSPETTGYSNADPNQSGGFIDPGWAPAQTFAPPGQFAEAAPADDAAGDWNAAPWPQPDEVVVADQHWQPVSSEGYPQNLAEPPFIEQVDDQPESPWPDAFKQIGPLQVPLSLFNVFLNEADESSRWLCSELAEWAMAGTSTVPDSAIARAHALAGSSATVGFAELSELARQLEQALSHEQSFGLGGGIGDADDARLFSDVAEEIRQLLHQFAAGFLKSPSAELRQRLFDQQRQFGERRQQNFDQQTSAVDTAAGDGFAAGTDWLSEIEVDDHVDAELFPIFEEEAQDLLPQLAAALRDWVRQPDQLDFADAAMRHLHTFKGGARLTGAMRLGELAHRLESRIERLATAVAAPQRFDVEALLAGSDAMQQAFENLRVSDARAYAAADAAAIDQAWQRPTDAAPIGFVAADIAFEPPALPLQSPHDALALAASSQDAAASPDDPQIDWARFQRPVPAATAALRGVGANPQASVRIRASLLERMVNQAGEVNMSRARIEVEMGQVRGAMGELGANVDRLRQQLHDIELQAEMQMSSRSDTARAGTQGFDPLEIDRFTRLQELARMMTESVNDVATVHRSLKRNLQRTEDELAAQTRLTRELQSDLLRTRMVEFDMLAERLHRVVRQTASEYGKPVELQIFDGRIELDRSVLDRLTPAFEHLLRNAVIHGIESTEQRLAAGKPATGQVQIRLHQQGNEVSIEVIDDGAGLDVDSIRSRAIAQGEPVIDGNEAELIFGAGFSTAQRLTESAGRGVGLDVVRTGLQAIDGQIEVSSVPGQGCHFSMRLPLTTATTQVLMLRCGDLSVAVPATLVERVRRISEDELAQAQALGHCSFGDHNLPFFWLGALLLHSAGSAETFGRSRPLVVLHSGKNRLALHVDEVLGQQEAVVKNLGPQLSRLPGLAGMSMLASGAVALIYNPLALVAEFADAARSLAMRPGPIVPLHGLAAQTPLILVVDDSLTVRRVTQRLLLREGYRVGLAKDGVEALELIAQDMPQLVLSDIEMPRMDGYELVEKLRGNELTMDLPVVMITSRIADKHRVHAESLGVARYLGKPYGEDELLSAVAQCLHPFSVF